MNTYFNYLLCIKLTTCCFLYTAEKNDATNIKKIRQALAPLIIIQEDRANSEPIKRNPIAHNRSLAQSQPISVPQKKPREYSPDNSVYNYKSPGREYGSGNQLSFGDYFVWQNESNSPCSYSDGYSNR